MSWPGRPRLSPAVREDDVLGVLEHAGGALTCAQIADALSGVPGWEPTVMRYSYSAQNLVRQTLERLRAKGVVVRELNRVGRASWRYLIPPDERLVGEIAELDAQFS